MIMSCNGNCDCEEQRSGCILCSEFLKFTKPPEQNPWNPTQNVPTQNGPDGNGIRPDPITSFVPDTIGTRSGPFSAPKKETAITCPPCKKTKLAPPGPKLGEPGVLFEDIGFPEPLGLTPFIPDSTCPTKEFIEENSRYEDDSEIWFVKPPPEPVTGQQFTSGYTATAQPPAETQMNDQTALSQAVSSVSSQDPDGIGWLAASHWTNSTWDGTPIDPTSPPGGNLCSWLRPSHPYVVRGLRERFYEVNPFADNTAPTPAEIDAWHIEVIRHFRNMFGIAIPVNPNARLYLEARWASERKRTEYWDSAYPPTGSYGDPYGPCFNPPGTSVDTSGGHCGASFFPSSTDRAPYISNAPYNNDFTTYPELSPYTNRYAQTEGNVSVNADLPWAIKFAFIISNWICNEGLTGHPGPYVNPTTAREEVGLDFWYTGGSTVHFRGKWR